MRKLTCIIVDDNPSAINKLLDFAKLTEQLIVSDSFVDPTLALRYLRNHHVDFVFLDMEMEPINGSQFLAQMPKEVKSVLCTGHREFGVDSYEYDCCDYLLKPFDFRRFMAAIERVKFDLGIADRSGTVNKGDAYYFLVKGDVRNKRTRVAFNEIIYIETINNYSNFYRVGQSRPLQTKHRLKEVFEVLPTEKFLRIGRSYVVNIDFFKSYKSRKVSVKGVNELLDAGERENYPEFYQWMERNTLKEKK